MEQIVSSVLSTINRYDMFEPGDSVVVAVSGGPDSVCLLHVLNELAGKFHLHLTVAHLDHSTRQGESKRDARFVERLAQRMGLECVAETADVASLKGCGVSFEAAARDCRYKFLERVARETGSAKVAVGHTANDQAETMLMRLVSGAGRRGLAGIRPVRPLGGVTLVRPLIHVKRDEILRFLESHDIPFRVDETNADPSYTRNRIRLKLIPVLEKEYNAHVVDALSRAAGCFRKRRSI